MGWEGTLKPLSATLKPLFAAGVGGDTPEAARATNARVGIREDRKLERRATRREALHLLHVENAAKHLERLPEPGVSFHCIMRGNYNGWDLVPAVLRLASPATIAELYVATLGFNERNSAELLELLDTGRVGRVTFICSHYFKATSADIYGPLASALASRGQRVLAMRSHAKILLFGMSDGRRFTIESSANLRSCNNIEQFSMTHDAALHDFHRAWMDEVVTAGTKP